jgi:hypothetical protein
VVPSFISLPNFSFASCVEIFVYSHIPFFGTLMGQTHGQESNLHILGVNVAGLLLAEVNRHAH